MFKQLGFGGFTNRLRLPRGLVKGSPKENQDGSVPLMWRTPLIWWVYGPVEIGVGGVLDAAKLPAGACWLLVPRTGVAHAIDGFCSPTRAD